MALPARIKLPDIYIGEMLEYQRITEDFNRTTTGSASYTNPDTSASYSVTSGGEEALAISLYNTDPVLKTYIYSDSDYDDMKTIIEANEAQVATNVTNISSNTTSISELATNKGVATDGQVLTSNGDGTSTFETLVVNYAWEEITNVSPVSGSSQIDFESLDFDQFEYIKILFSCITLANVGGLSLSLRINDLATTIYRVEEYQLNISYDNNQSTSANKFIMSNALAQSTDVVPAMGELLINNPTDQKPSFKCEYHNHGSSVSQAGNHFITAGYINNLALITKISLIAEAGTTFDADTKFVIMGVRK